MKEKDNQLEEQRQVLEQQLLTSVSPFCVLPPKPTHEVTGRDSEVSEITQKLGALKGANDDALSTLYISGNPGSGKSQLAHLLVSVSKGMHPDHARSLLTLLSEVSDGEMEDEVARTLEYQLLALASVSIYVREVRQRKVSVSFGWGGYLEKVAGGQQSTTETILAETNPRYQNSMTTAITLAVKEAMATNRVINHLFTFLVLCSPQPIPQDLAVNYIMEIDEEFTDKGWIRSKRNRCSLLLSEEEGDSVCIRVHGVVRDVLDSLKTNYAKELYIKAVVGAVASFAKFNDFDTFTIGSILVPHLRKLILRVKYLFSEQDLPQVRKVGDMPLQGCLNGPRILGKMCLYHFEYEDAKNCSEVALEIIYSGNANDALGPEHVDVAASYNNLGTVCRSLGDFRQAKDNHALALNIVQKQHGPDHVDVAAFYNNLGTVHRGLGDFQQAKDNYARALDIRLKQLGPEHVKVAASYNSLDNVYRSLGNFQKAKDSHARALDIRLKQLGREHVNVAAS
ncbi:uncharacterized protein [Pocillopora verrucosa]|uniref:uncharacterized protein n=1 Tax=Pocillopora verrucosa TaxID=203993 RepID=UPI00333E4237